MEDAWDLLERRQANFVVPVKKPAVAVTFFTCSECSLVTSSLAEIRQHVTVDHPGTDARIFACRFLPCPSCECLILAGSLNRHTGAPTTEACMWCWKEVATTPGAMAWHEDVCAAKCMLGNVFQPMVYKREHVCTLTKDGRRAMTTVGYYDKKPSLEWLKNNPQTLEENGQKCSPAEEDWFAVVPLVGLEPPEDIFDSSDD